MGPLMGQAGKSLKMNNRIGSKRSIGGQNGQLSVFCPCFPDVYIVRLEADGRMEKRSVAVVRQEDSPANAVL